MKLQPASKKEVKRIASGTFACSAIMILALLILSLVGVGTFSYRIFIGAIGGSLVAIGNFTIMCLTVQSAVGIEDKKRMKSFIQGSYNGRLMLQAVWVVVCFMVPHIHLVAGAAPLLFPSVVIFYLQSRGKLMPPDPPRTVPAAPSQEDNLEENLGPFEI